MTLRRRLRAPTKSTQSEDPRLARLFDYTKFHIGVYLSAGSGLLAMAALAVEHGSVLNEVVGSPLALVVAVLAMLFAGLAGGVVASACTRCRTFEELWDGVQGPLRLFVGATWANIEHTAFWISVALVAYSVISAPGVTAWIFR